MKKIGLFFLGIFSLFSCESKETKLSNYLDKIRNSTTSTTEAEEIVLLHKFIGKNSISFESKVQTKDGATFYYPEFFNVKNIESVNIDFFISPEDTLHFKGWKPQKMENFFYLYNE
ncbi:hypothetical protein [Flavobacterium hercynium]|uniref:Lipoprotein n=1 Tax=Flavobacterium hercynium TaxID=387094 RepID=A0A226GV62_9FLAO|nr:hypothetical protein [Flavobacterium hercynium]OXA85883.1 hypothetical protein B0A66_18670 [Flavobacterium hercynium]SMP33709.1 hypothetical protein SAMN06265346_11720 [Flavobacterium hercynium]